jgi:hypothetical protein
MMLDATVEGEGPRALPARLGPVRQLATISCIFGTWTPGAAPPYKG